MEVHVYELWCCGFTYYIKIKMHCYFFKKTVISTPFLPTPYVLHFLSSKRNPF